MEKSSSISSTATATTTTTSKSRGICQRLFSFFINYPLLACGFSSNNMGNQSVSEIPIKGSSRNGLNPEVAVEYRHDIGWFNDPTRYKSLIGARKKARSEEKDNSTKNLAPEPPNPRQRMLLRTVTSNIDKKAEFFITKKKENLNRSYSTA